MRIISGNYRGRKLNTIEGDTTRPTTDRVKESMFNLIQFEIMNSKILDLFSGSGSLGIECLSRGASEVVFNDKSRECIEVIEKNLKNIKGNYKIESKDYNQLLAKYENANFDIIFVDCPYAFEIQNELLNTIYENNLLASDGFVVYEHNKPFSDLPSNYEIFKEKKYGIVIVTILKRL